MCALLQELLGSFTENIVILHIGDDVIRFGRPKLLDVR